MTVHHQHRYREFLLNEEARLRRIGQDFLEKGFAEGGLMLIRLANECKSALSEAGESL